MIALSLIVAGLLAAAPTSQPAVSQPAASAPAAGPASRPTASAPSVSEFGLVPTPRDVRPMSGEFVIGPDIAVLTRSTHRDMGAAGEAAARVLREATGYPVPVREYVRGMDTAGHCVLLTSGSHDVGGLQGYELTVSERGIGAFAVNPQGLFYAAQTLRQLLPAASPSAQSRPASQPALRLPALHISDAPRYRWRGMLLDSGRHFIDKATILRTIDLLGLHKMNVLHWHLTEDQGWRIQIRSFPKLTEVGALRRATRESEQPRDAQGRYGGFYSQDDVREIVAYAKSRFVQVVPEIELPGHCGAALAAYPELSCTGGPFEVSTRWGVHEDVYCAGNDRVFEFLEAVLGEVCEIFPSEFIHIGGDEVPKKRWKSCSKCQERIRAEGLKDEAELQSWFIRRVESMLAARGRKLIGWDEILEGGLPPGAVVQSWRGMDGAIAAARAGHSVISSPTSHCYLDYPQGPDPASPGWMGFIDLAKVYAFEPTPAGLSAEAARLVLGAEGNLWTEHAPPDRLDRQAFPRLCALAEVTWSDPAKRNFADFSDRMRIHYKRLDALGVQYYIPPPQAEYDADGVTPPIAFRFHPLPLDAVIRYTIDAGEPDGGTPAYTQPLALPGSCTVRAATFLPNGRKSDTVEFPVRALRALSPVEPPQTVPGLAYEYFENRWERLPDFDSEKVVRSGIVARPDLHVRNREEEFGLRLRGFFEAKTAGEHRFHLRSDDGARLILHGETIIDLDGLHAAGERSGAVLLEVGRHPLEIEYFQAGGNTALMVWIEAPGEARRPLPADRLSCVPPTPVAIDAGSNLPPGTVQPLPRDDAGWRQRFDALSQSARRPDASLVFIGDSITQGWEDAGRQVWERHYAPRGAVNLGISGDRTQHVLWRLKNGNLAGLVARETPPKLAVVMIGTNNSNGDDHSAGEIALGIEAIVRELRAQLPRTHVLLLAIFPRGLTPDAQRAKNAEASRVAAQACADGTWVHYLDIGAGFVAPDGTLRRDLMPDLLHLSPEGYQLWADSIEPKVRELLSE